MSDDVYQEVAPSDMTGLDDIYARKSGLKRSPSPRILQGMMPIETLELSPKLTENGSKFPIIFSKICP